jgi:hypothetical protein
MRADRTWIVAVLGTLACAGQQASSRTQSSAPAALSAYGWIDVTATLDPATTPVYEGDAPMKFETYCSRCD